MRLLLLVLLSGCATMSGARPLSPGETAVGVTVGGGLIDFGGPLPLPNTVVEVRRGVGVLAERPIDVSAGLNGTALPFGLLQGHVGSSWLMLDQHGAAPALAITDRVFFGLDPAPQAWVADQVELSASWLVGQQLVYLSVSEYLDLLHPSLTLTPALGASFDFGEAGGFFVQPEVRYYGVNQVNVLDTVPWVTDGAGILGISVGLGTRLGGGR